MNYIICINNIHVEKFLTINKQYELIELDKNLEQYTVICDQKFEASFKCNRFTTILNNRSSKLKKILND